MMLNTQSFCGKVVQFLRHIATMSEDQVKCICSSRVYCECVEWVTGCDDYMYESRAAHELEYRVVITSCAPEIKLVDLSSVSQAQQWYDECDAVRRCHGDDETARVHREQGRVVLGLASIVARC